MKKVMALLSSVLISVAIILMLVIGTYYRQYFLIFSGGFFVGIVTRWVVLEFLTERYY